MNDADTLVRWCSRTGTCSSPSTRQGCCMPRPAPSRGGPCTCLTALAATTLTCWLAWCSQMEVGPARNPEVLTGLGQWLWV